MLSSRFKLLCTDAGLSIDEAAKLLHVTPRTIRYWFSGQVTVPYAAYKLVRVLRWFELPGKQWSGWHFHGGKLWTPEGHGFEPRDSNWWSLLVRQARSFHSLYRDNLQLRAALRVQGQTAAVVGDASASPETDAAGPGAPALAGDRRAAPGSNLFIEHFSKSESGNQIDNGAIMGPWPITFDYPPSWTLTPAPAATGSASASTPSSASHWMPTLDSQISQDKPPPPLLRPKPRRPSVRPQKLRHLRSGKKPASSVGTGNGKRSNSPLGGAA
jgi:transcriptional regulator with XRE-family HTH domain